MGDDNPGRTTLNLAELERAGKRLWNALSAIALERLPDELDPDADALNTWADRLKMSRPKTWDRTAVAELCVYGTMRPHHRAEGEQFGHRLSSVGQTGDRAVERIQKLVNQLAGELSELPRMTAYHVTESLKAQGIDPDSLEADLNALQIVVTNWKRTPSRPQQRPRTEPYHFRLRLWQILRAARVKRARAGGIIAHLLIRAGVENYESNPDKLAKSIEQILRNAEG